MLVIKSEFECNQLFINENGTIKEVTFVSMKVIKQEDKHIVIWKYKHNDIEGEITTEYGQCPFSPSADKAVENCTNILGEDRVYARGTGIMILRDNTVNKFYLNAYTFRNGVVQQENLEVSSILYKKRYNRVSVELVEDVKYYETKDECIAFNKITEIDYNGNEGVFKHSGYMQDMVAYTDEQKKAIKALTKALENVKASGLQWLISDYDFSLINVKNLGSDYKISDTEWTCGEEGVELDIYNNCPQIAKIKSVDISRNYCSNPVLVLK